MKCAGVIFEAIVMTAFTVIATLIFLAELYPVQMINIIHILGGYR